MCTNTISKKFFSYESLKCEEKRLETFIDWPAEEIINPSELAKDGFYYLRTYDHCACVFCRGIVGAWEKGDVARAEHQRHFPTCPFINGEAVGNIPIEQCRIISHIDIDMLKISFHDAYEVITKKSFFGMPLPQHSAPENMDFISQIEREKSFEKWPLVHQKPKELAEAGFFYCGLSDHVRCFHCGYGLRNWEKGDNPWEEHARWYPECIFVHLKKGKEFVEQVRRKKPPHFPKGRKITERDLDLLMRLDIPKAVVDMGFPIKNVRSAVREKLEVTGLPFFTKDTCVRAVITLMELEEMAKSRSSSSSPKDESTDETGCRSHFLGNTTNANYCSASPETPTNNPAEDGSTDETGHLQSSHHFFGKPPETPLNSAPTNNSAEVSLEPSSMSPHTSALSSPKRECKVCVDAEIEIVFLPCTHMITCPSCAAILNKCPICRGEIKHIVKPIWS